MQAALYDFLCTLHGSDSVGTECDTGAGTRIDVVVRKGGTYDFYEIKTGNSARSCIRQALAQLLEYSFWPGGQEAERLIIVGEPSPDQESRSFLAELRRRFSLPIEYRRIHLPSGKLMD
jgi:hypothetical protein